MPRSAAVLHDALGALERPRPGDRRRYVTPLELTLADEPALLQILKLWTDEEREAQLDGSPAWYAPIHAYRALAELGANSVVPAMLELLDKLDELGDQWYLEELPGVCARIGAEAVAPLTRYLLDGAHVEYPRVAVAHSLCEVALHEPAMRDEVVEALAQVLARADVNLASLNAFVIGYLVDLRAQEHSECIRQAFTTGIVDTMVCGGWETISNELRYGRRPVSMEPIFSPQDLGATTRDQPKARSTRVVKPKRDKAARTRQKAARKRNRKRK